LREDRDARGLENSGDQGQKRALAAPALSDDGDELAGSDRERNASERLDLALEAKVTQRDVADLNFRQNGGAAGCRRLHGSPRLGGEFAQHQILEFYALCRGSEEHTSELR